MIRTLNCAALAAMALILVGSSGAGENPQLRELDRLEQTVRDLHSLATTCHAYHTDHGVYPGPTQETVPAEFLRIHVSPMYIRTFPVEDGWGNPFLFWSDGQSYRLLSHGSDGVAGGTGFGEDVILVDGEFTSPPILREPPDQLELQKTTMEMIRTIALVVESFSTDEGHYPGPTEGDVEASFLREFAEPVYIRSMTAQDAWGNGLLYWSDGKSYRIASLGRDGQQDVPFDEIDPGAMNRLAGDIVFVDGRFLQWPEGPQH